MKFLITVFAICLSVATTSVHAQTVADGYAAYDAGDYDKAKSIFHSLADAGDANAMNAIGRLYDQGKGYSKNIHRACDWYERSAIAGYVSAQNNLAICYESGEGRTRDIEKAIFWLEKSAEQGRLQAQVNLVRLYNDRNRDRAIYWGQKAVDQNSAFARVVMWGFDLPHTGLHASTTDIVCVIAMNRLLDNDLRYCDYEN
jgi:TPR repeat protein